jgi:hypothetical protein
VARLAITAAGVAVAGESGVFVARRIIVGIASTNLEDAIDKQSRKIQMSAGSFRNQAPPNAIAPEFPVALEAT